MTDQHEPEQALPTAGRRPPDRRPQTGDDEETARLSALPASGAPEVASETDDEPTVVQPPPPGAAAPPAGANGPSPSAGAVPAGMPGQSGGVSGAADPSAGAGGAAEPPWGAGGAAGPIGGVPPVDGASPGPGESTRVIGPPGDDEPTVQQPQPDRPSSPAPDLDGPTRRLWDPAPAEAQPAVSPAERPAADASAPSTAAAQTGPDQEKTLATEGAADASPEPAAPTTAGDAPAVPPWRRLSSAGALIWVLLALFGFTLVVQLRSNDSDQGLATARQEDLVRILSDLEARDSRLQSEINALENSQRQLTSGVAGREAAIAEAGKRADELGLLAGTLPGRGPGLRIVLDKVKASAILNAVQELRGAGGEVMQLAGADGGVVRVVASSYFVDAEGGGIVVDDAQLSGPYTLDVIGSPQTMQTALQIPGGVVASVNSGGGSVTMEQRPMVEVTAVRKATTLQYARPVS